MDSGTEIAQNAVEIGGDAVRSCVSQDDVGPYAVIEEGGSDTVVAVLEDFSEIKRVAAYAITPAGGYGSVRIEASGLAPTHADFMDWLI